MKKYVCLVCGYVYDEAKGISEAGIEPGTSWDDLPENWVCPLCGATKANLSTRCTRYIKETRLYSKAPTDMKR